MRRAIYEIQGLVSGRGGEIVLWNLYRSGAVSMLKAPADVGTRTGDPVLGCRCRIWRWESNDKSTSIFRIVLR